LVKKTFLPIRNRKKRLVRVVTGDLAAKAGVTVVATVAAGAVVKEETLLAGTAKMGLDPVVQAVATGAAKDNCKLISKEIKDVTAEKDRI
jgi:hypothetical protein